MLLLLKLNNNYQERLELKEPYNTYIFVYGIPEKGLFEAEKLSIIQNYLILRMKLTLFSRN